MIRPGGCANPDRLPHSPNGIPPSVDRVRSRDRVREASSGGCQMEAGSPKPVVCQRLSPLGNKFGFLFMHVGFPWSGNLGLQVLELDEVIALAA